MNEKEQRAPTQVLADVTRALKELERLSAVEERETKPWYRERRFMVLASLVFILLAGEVVLLAMWAIDQLPIGG